MNNKDQLSTVHVITSLENGGAEAFLYSLVKESKQKRVTIISMRDDWGYGKRFEKLGCKVIVLGMKPVQANLKHFFQLVRILKREQPAAVFTWMHHANLFAGLAAKVAFIPTIIWGIHDAFMQPEKEKLATRFIIRVTALFSYFVPNKIIYVAKKASEVHASIYYDQRKKIVIPNGYDVERFKPNINKRLVIRKQLGIDENSFLIGMIARFDPLKDHETFMKVAKILLDKGLNVHFLLCGSGVSSKNKQLSNYINRYDLAKHLTLAETRDDIENVYSALDVFLLTSLTEAFPNVLCEAMASAVPCVSTDVGDASIIIADTGAITRTQDYTQMALEIEKMLLLPTTDWNQKKEKARQHVVQNFSIKKITKRYMELV